MHFLKPTLKSLAFTWLTLVSVFAEPINLFGRTTGSEDSGYSELEFDTLASNPKLSDRIVGGKDVSNKDFLSTAYVVLSAGGQSFHYGGTLIAPNVVLTAASILKANILTKVDPSIVSVYIGSEKDPKSTANKYSAVKVIPHPQFSTVNNINNIGLILLDKDVPSDLATPIKIYNKDISDDLKVQAAGWGLTSSSLSAVDSSTLKYIDIQLSSQPSCNKTLFIKWTSNNDATICAENKPGEGICDYDQGGPLIATISGSKQLVGVINAISYISNKDEGNHCASKGGGSFYANARFFKSWIAAQTNISESQFVSGGTGGGSTGTSSPTGSESEGSGKAPSTNVGATTTDSPASPASPTSTQNSSSSSLYSTSSLLGCFLLAILAKFF